MFGPALAAAAALLFEASAQADEAGHEAAPPAATASAPAAPAAHPVRPQPPPPEQAKGFVFDEMPAAAQAASTIGILGVALAMVTLGGIEDPPQGLVVFGAISSGVGLLGFATAGIILLVSDDDPPSEDAHLRAPLTAHAGPAARPGLSFRATF